MFPKHQRSRFGFSLVELLAVIAIIVVMVGMGAYIFSGNSSFAAALSTSTSQMAGAIEGARQLAITSNCRTRFAVLTNSTSNKDEWRLHSYVILKEDPGSSLSSLTGQPTFAVVTPIEQLRSGIYVQRDTSLELPKDTRQMLERTATCTVQNVPAAEYAYIEFLPTGAATTTTGENIFVVERAVEPGVSLPNNHNFARIGVTQHTGRVRVERP
jgi:prepilin-type N-terminal cleavage/methylation domain-containing protein